MTQTRKDEEWITDSEGLYRNLIEQAPDVIFSLDANAVFVFVNRRIEHFLGYSVQSVLGQPLSRFLASEDRERLTALRRLSRDQVWDEEPAFVDTNGRKKFARIRLKASFDGNNQIVGFEGVMRDRTVRRKLEEDLKASKQALVEKIKIIDELYEHIVQHGKCKAIEEHTAEVAHELRQPLAIVGGFARRMARLLDTGAGSNHEKHRQYTSIIVTEVQRLERILDRLIDFTRRGNLHLERLNPHDLIAYILDITEYRLRRKQIHPVLNFGREVGEIPIDPGRFQQLMLNLISNAIEASPLGGTIEIETGVSLPSEKAIKTGELNSEGYFEIKIKNQGPVIEPEALQKVFNPFFTTKQNGTGLGLTVSKRIVEDHTGSISLKSDEDGTVFTVWLPLATPSDFPPAFN